MPKQSVLLTGAAGRIGPHLVDDFRARYDLRIFDRKPVRGDIPVVTGDLQDRAALQTAMEGIEVVVHLAATSDEAPFLEQLVPNNIVGVYHVYQTALEAGVRRIVFASTAQTVSRYSCEHAVAIDDPPRPGTLYGATKVFGEVMGRYYHDKHGIEFVGIRIGAFQPYDSPAFQQYRWARDLWLSPRDAVRLFCRAIEKPNVGYALVFGTSITERECLSRDAARVLLDFEPKDNVADFLAG